MIGYFLLIGSETQGVHDLLQIQVLLTDVETQLVHYHLHLVLELLPIAFVLEVPSENRMHEDLIPGDTPVFCQLQAATEEVFGFRGKTLSFDV